MIIGKGTRQHVVDAISCATCRSRSSTTSSCCPAEVAAALDDATVLVLPSWPEGLGRVVIEAFARGRGRRRHRRRRHARPGRGRRRGDPDPARPTPTRSCVSSTRVLDRPGARRRGSGRLRTCATPTGTRRPRSSRSSPASPRRPDARARREVTRCASPSSRRSLDADHPALAQTLDIVDALARRCEEVVVICDHVGRYEPAVERADPDVRLGARGSAAALAFERAARRRGGHGATRRPDAVLVHMVPTFVTLAAPLCKPLRIPLGLWYTHWNADRSLRAGDARSRTSSSASTAGRSRSRAPRCRGIGHAIDVGRVPAARPGPKRHDGPLRLLALGRMTAWKGYTTMLAGLELATAQGLDATLEIRGPTMTTAEQEHLEELAQDRRREPRPARPRGARAARLRATRSRSCSRPPMSSSARRSRSWIRHPGQGRLRGGGRRRAGRVEQNPLLDKFLGALPVQLRFQRRDPDDLARVLLAVAAAGPEVRAAVGVELRRRVEAGHSVESWADAVIRELCPPVSGPPR